MSDVDEAKSRKRLLKSPDNSTVSNPSNEEQTSDHHHKQQQQQEMAQPSFYLLWVRPLIAEFVGQLLFAYMHSSSVNTISTTSTVMGNALLPAITDGFTVMILIIAIGHISGCHVNFAVTTAVFLGGGMKWFMVPLYLVSQILGSLCGAGLAFVSSGGAAYGQFALGAGVSIGSGLLMEIVLTFFLTFAVLMAAVDLNSGLAAFAIGFTILIDILAGFNISGGCMNPTLSFGPAVVSGVWQDYWIYWVGPLLGAAVAACIFRLFLGGEARLLFKQADAAPPSPAEDVKMEKGLPSQSSSRSQM